MAGSRTPSKKGGQSQNTYVLAGVAVTLLLLVGGYAATGGFSSDDDSRRTAERKKDSDDDKKKSKKKSSKRSKKKKKEESLKPLSTFDPFQALPTSQGGASTPSIPQPAATATIILEWPSAERRNASIRINGLPYAFAPYGETRLTVAPGRSRVTIQRTNYEDVRFDVSLSPNETYVYRPNFVASAATRPPPTKSPAQQPPPSFDDWKQDFEQAKRKARRENKSILVAFCGSDWCGYSMRMAYEIFLKPEFRSQADRQYVLVFVDQPRGAEAKRKVKSASRNARLAQTLSIDATPTILLADSGGQVYARTGYTSGGVPSFMRTISGLSSLRSTRDQLFAAVDRATACAKIPPAIRAMEWLAEQKLLPYYQPKMSQWLADAQRFDPTNQKGQELLFAMVWTTRAGHAIEGKQKSQIERVVRELDQWENRYDYRDKNMGGRIHLLAAIALVSIDKPDQAIEHLEQGLAYQPTDPEVRQRLAIGAELLGGGGGS
ncbi:MAG: thioredoxin family protein, partial [Pirellulales bacterium]|nr:thioredoxin family protein [Pirellulales bacterium]